MKSRGTGLARASPANRAGRDHLNEPAPPLRRQLQLRESHETRWQSRLACVFGPHGQKDLVQMLFY